MNLSSACHAAQATEIVNDLDGDGRVERIALHPQRAQTLSVSQGKVLLWRAVPREWKPWKLTIADADGDGQREIAVGVYKSTRFLPRPHNCLFLYGWKGRSGFPKWLGSSLSKPFSDFRFANLDTDRADELIALEVRRDGKKCVTVYSWNGFGFTADWQRGAWTKAKLIGVQSRRVVVEADGRRITLK